jgi:HEPN domain-containing protein
MKNTELADAWLRRAVSSMEKARIGKISDALFYEDLCFDCQQAAEKALKALLIYVGTPFPKTHSLNMLIALLKRQNVPVPDEIESVVILNDYAVATRYPGEYEPVTAEEYLEAVEIAAKVIEWVSETCKN